MNINSAGAYGIYKKNTVLPDSSKAARAAKAGAEKTDTVSISRTASQHKEAAKLSGEIAKSVMEPTSEARLESLREAVKNDTYSVSSDNLADAILGRAFAAE